MQIYFLTPKTKCAAVNAARKKRNRLHNQNMTIKVTNFIQIGDGQHKMINAQSLHYSVAVSEPEDSR
jgi:hypothetical protein